MRKSLLLSLLLLAAAAPAASEFKLRFPPNPPRYLKQIPLNEITERDLIDQLGIPQNRIEIDGEARWQYDRVDPYNGVRVSWSYVLVEGLVVDAIYNASGCPFGACPYNGMTARQEQSDD